MHTLAARFATLPRSDILFLIGAAIIIASLWLIVWVEVRAILKTKEILRAARKTTKAINGE